MNKAELIIAIAEKSGLTKAQAESAFNATFEIITSEMAKKEKVMIQGFGGFVVKIRAARKGRNPATGNEMLIPETAVASFKPATQLKETINN